MSPPPDAPYGEWWMRLLELIGAGLLGAVGMLVATRVRFNNLERDVKDLKTALEVHERNVTKDAERVEKMIQDSVRDIQKSIETNRDSAANRDISDARDAKQEIVSIRSDNAAHHSENTARLHIMREQLFAIVRLMVQMARATPGMNPSDVDDAMGRVMSLEIKRAD